jgi:integrase
MSGKRIGLRDVRGLSPGETIWDAAVPGFGARRQQSEAIAYILKYRTKEGRQRWMTIGRHGAPWTPDEAREEARRVLGGVATGEDPSADKMLKRKAATVSELCDQYLADAEAGRLLTRRKVAKKTSTLSTDKGRIERHIKPLLGNMKVPSVTRADIEKFMHDVAEGKTAGRTKTTKKRGLANVRGGKGTASRTTGLLGAIFTYAIGRNIRTDNPVHGVIRYADGRKERRLSSLEYQALGTAMKQSENANLWPPAILAVKFLTLTGWRSGEALKLTWKEVDIESRTATLSDSKTGRSVRPISNAACAILKEAKKLSNDSLVFPATRGVGSMLGFPKFWKKISSVQKIPPDITPHTLRHSFASLGGDLGYSELTIGAIIGHRSNTITSRYIHSADTVLLSAVDAIADETARRLFSVNQFDANPNLSGLNSTSNRINK